MIRRPRASASCVFARVTARATFWALASTTAERSALAATTCLFAALTRPRFEKSKIVCVSRTRPSYALNGPILVGITTGPGKENPRVFELKERFTQEPDTVRSGSNPERTCRTRAAAASERKPAMETDGGTACEAPVAWRTASANERRSGAGDCAASEPAQVNARISVISGLLADTMEIEVDVSVEVTADVEAFGHARRERLAGDDGVHHGRHGELCRDRHVHAAELTGFDTPLQYSGHQAMTAGDDFLVVEAGELRKIVRFRHHQLRDAHERRFADETPVLAYETLEQFARAAGERLGQLLALGEHRNDRLPDQRLEQRLFVLEVEIDGAFGDTGSTRDVLELRGGKAPIGEDLQRGADDLFRTGIFPAAPTGFGSCLRHERSNVTY